MDENRLITDSNNYEFTQLEIDLSSVFDQKIRDAVQHVHGLLEVMRVPQHRQATLMVNLLLRHACRLMVGKPEISAQELGFGVGKILEEEQASYREHLAAQARAPAPPPSARRGRRQP
jgi:hypothetical protein